MPPLQRANTSNNKPFPGGFLFLSLAQIHRLLRPLRNKIKTLTRVIENAARKPSTSAPAGPLAVVPHPTRLQSRKFLMAHGLVWDPASTIHNVSLDDFSRMVYAIAEAFRNVVARAYGDELLHRGECIPTLAEICTSMIGADIEASVMELLRADARSDDTSSDGTEEDIEEDEDDETDIIDGCYEQIPEHLRR
jgi:hypothetical protein